MSAFTEIKQRDAELYSAYKKALKEPGTDNNQAIIKAIHSPTSRYWVSVASVYREILARQRGYHARYDPSSRRNKPHSCRQRMFDELYSIYLKLKNSRYYKNCSTLFLVSFVVGHPAPRFYIDFRRAQVVIEQQRRLARQQRQP